MIATQDTYYFAVTPPAAIVDDAAFTTTEIDTVIAGNKYDYCTIVVLFGAMDIGVAAMAVTESDTAGSGHANITGLVGGTDFTLPSATEDNKFYVFSIDLKGRKRYLDLSLTGGNGTAGTYATAFAILSRGKIAPNSAADQGASVALYV